MKEKIVLIGAGLLMLWQRLYTPTPVPTTGGGAPGVAHEGLINLYAIFGGVERKVTTDDFRGGHITAMFGGVDLNLRRAGMRAESAVVDISAIFGGVDIKVPPTWLVIVDGASIFGGFSDKSAQPAPDTPGIKRLFIKGAAVFGGVSVKN